MPTRSPSIEIFICAHTLSSDAWVSIEQYGEHGKPEGIIESFKVSREQSKWDRHDDAIKRGKELGSMYGLPVYITDETHQPNLRLGITMFERVSKDARERWKEQEAKAEPRTG